MKNKEKKINPFKINRQNRKICTASGIFFSLLLCINPVFGQTGADNSPVSSPKTEKAESQVPAGSAVKETPEKTRVNVEKTDGNPAEKDITNKVEPNIENKDIKQTKKDDFTPAAPVKKIEQPGDADGLLKITEGSYKYRRIPDIKIPDDSDSKADNSKEQEEVITSGDESGEVSGEDNEKSFFGVSKKTGDTIIILFLLAVIIGVIIVLKFKSKGKDDNVLRRFPRA